MGKKVSIIEVAKKAGVSKSTVSRVLNDSYGVSKETREKVLNAAHQLKYRTNISARYLRNNSSNLLGILISKDDADEGITHLVHSRKISGIVNKVSELGYDVLIFIEDIHDHKRLNEVIREKGLSGILLLNDVPVDVLESFRAYDLPFVLVNWSAKDYEHQCYVRTDLAAATRMGLDILTQRGYKDIGVINWEDSLRNEKTIENEFINYMQGKGLEWKDCVWNTEFDPGRKAVEEYIRSSGKRAYLSFSYNSSIYILDYCREKGISIPGDIALLSYEFFPFFDYLHPRLSGLRQQAELMGEKAAEKLIQILQGKENVKSELIPPEIVLRETC
ncbi:MAG TPA: LacI family transcriptional regulator [Clostridiaceae bacterium]|nr:LacI family transcriptional regulator [Clostridiaceae bacterium]